MKYILLISTATILFFNACQKPVAEPEETKDISQVPQVMCAPKIVDTDWYKSDKIAPLFEGLDAVDFPISTSNQLVQKYFNQGMVLAYGFNHAEAARSFHYATKLDPGCAMAYWGFAYVLGPNYNAGMESDNYERAYEAIQKAIQLSDKTTKKEQRLISAMSARYTEEVKEDRSALDLAYAEEMGKVFQQFPKNADIGAMYAESLMNLHPWDLYDKNGNPKEWTPEILQTIQKVLEIDPKHPGAHHFYIHAVEASSTPEKGLASAKIFDDGLTPGAGHLVHMPSHIYIRTGDYHKGTLSNIRAVKADSTYLEVCHAHGAYPLAYYPHNWHFMAATATLEGNSKWAILAANKLAEGTDKRIMAEPGWGTLQHYYVTPYNVYVKFGKWDEILQLPQEADSLIYPVAVRHYARGMAFLGKKDLGQAKKELAELEKFSKDERLKEITVWDINDTYTLIQIAYRVLKAETLAAEQKYSESISLLQEAIVIEDGLNYNEPPDWFFSVRHHLGAVQLNAQQFSAAITTFQEDLQRLPKNGWALHGLKLAYEGQKKFEDAQSLDQDLKRIWATADVKLAGSVVQ